MKANSEMRFTETPIQGIIHAAPRNDSGMPRLTQNASRKRRNSARLMNTRMRPTMPLRINRSRRSRSTLAWFCHVVRWTPSGKRASFFSMNSFTWVTIFSAP